MKLKLFFLMTGFVFFATYPLSYDFAVRSAQKGDNKTADQQMRKIIIDCPDDADVLYDAGVIADQLNNHDQAFVYFSRAAQCTSDKNIQFRSYFNAGNSLVESKKLKSALEYYDKSLTIEPHNEYARHNRERVVEMLKQQEQQQNQQKDETQNSDQKENKDNQENQKQQKQSENQNQQQQNTDNQNDQQKQNQNNSSSESQSENNQLDQKSQGNQRENSNQNSNSEERKQQRNQEEKQQSAANDKKGKREQKFDEKSENTDNEREQQQGKQHEKSPEKQNKNKNNTSIPSQDQQEQAKDTTGYAHENVNDQLENAGCNAAETNKIEKEKEVNDPWLLKVLTDQELHDKAVNKKLMEARIHQQGGKNDQNCW